MVITGIVCCSVLSTFAAAQSHSSSAAEDSLAEVVRGLEARLEKVESELASARADAAASREKSTEFQREISELRKQVAHQDPSSEPTDEERLDLLSAKVDEQYQTKVESSSKYSLRMSGMVLLNAFTNRGFADAMENPTYAKEVALDGAATSFGGTLRQTQLGFDLFGPQVFGGRASGSLQFDFAGGFALTPSGDSLGLVRLRTGTVRVDWEKTSLVIGQDGLFFAPNSATSFASMQEPAMANSGQLWAWVPQIRLERSFATSSRSALRLQAGILDPVSLKVGDGSGERLASVGERSHRPAMAARISWSRPLFGSNIVLGYGYYRAQQMWGDSPPTAINSWVHTLDWALPVTRFAELSGAYHRGRSIADLGGGLGQSVGAFLTSDDLAVLPGAPSDLPLNSSFEGLTSLGGWLQIKVKPVRRLEINIAGGQENRLASDAESAASTQDYFDQDLVRNRTYMANVIFRPRSNLVLSTEYRHIRSFPLGEDERTMNHLNLGVGILF